MRVPSKAACRMSLSECAEILTPGTVSWKRQIPASGINSRNSRCPIRT